MPAISLHDLLALIGAVLLAAVGGEAFLRGVLGTAAWLRVPKLLVATTLAAFATSCPEFAVSILAALDARPEIGLGNVLGANVVNVSLVMGIALVIAPLGVARGSVSHDFLLALGAPVLTFVLALDGELSRMEGVVLLVLFTGWLGSLVLRHVNRSVPDEVAPDHDSPPARGLLLLYGVIGVTTLMLAGNLFVTGASGIASAFGIAPFIIGAVVVALGTTMPELVTMLLSRLRGQDDVGVGTLLGSNLFNGLAIVGTSATIHPIAVQPAMMAPAVALCVIALLLLIPGPSGVLGRLRGGLLLIAYASFVGLSLWVERH